MERTTTEKPEREARGYSSKFQWLANIGRGIHFFFLMSVSIIHNLTWVHFKPPSTASPILVTQFEIVQGTCNTAINIWKTLFFSIDVLSEEKVLFIVTQILTAIIFESYVPRLLFWCHPPFFKLIAKFIVTFLTGCTYPISWCLAWILENIFHGSFKAFCKSFKSKKSESQQEGSTEEIPDSTEENVGGTESDTSLLPSNSSRRQDESIMWRRIKGDLIEIIILWREIIEDGKKIDLFSKSKLLQEGEYSSEENVSGGTESDTTSHSSSDSSSDQTIKDDFMQISILWKQIIEDGKKIEWNGCFSTPGEGGHYHYDATLEEVVYEGYFVMAGTMYPVNRPSAEAHFNCAFETHSLDVTSRPKNSFVLAFVFSFLFLLFNFLLFK